MPGFSSWAGLGPGESQRREVARAVPEAPAGKEYLVINSILQSNSRGIRYRCSPALSDTCTDRVAAFGSRVRGVLYNEDWLQVGKQAFLPVKINGYYVLISQQASSTVQFEGATQKTWECTGPQRLLATGCRHPRLGRAVRGTYSKASEHHSRPAYKKLLGGAAIYYWDERDGSRYEGWWIGPFVGSNEGWCFNPSCSVVPPSTGWEVPWGEDVDATLRVSETEGSAEMDQEGNMEGGTLLGMSGGSEEAQDRKWTDRATDPWSALHPWEVWFSEIDDCPVYYNIQDGQRVYSLAETGASSAIIEALKCERPRYKGVVDHVDRKAATRAPRREPQPPAEPPSAPGAYCEVRGGVVKVQRAPSVGAVALDYVAAGGLIELFDWDVSRQWRSCWHSFNIRNPTNGPGCWAWVQFYGPAGDPLLWPKGLRGTKPPLGPLCVAAYEGNAGHLEACLSEGAEVDAPDGGGRTPLTLAAGQGHADCCVLLLAARADASCVVGSGGRAAHMALPAPSRALLRALAGEDFHPGDLDAAMDGLRPDVREQAERMLDAVAAEQAAQRTLAHEEAMRAQAPRAAPVESPELERAEPSASQEAVQRQPKDEGQSRACWQQAEGQRAATTQLESRIQEEGRRPEVEKVKASFPAGLPAAHPHESLGAHEASRVESRLLGQAVPQGGVDLHHPVEPDLGRPAQGRAEACEAAKRNREERLRRRQERMEKVKQEKEQARKLEEEKQARLLQEEELLRASEEERARQLEEERSVQRVQEELVAALQTSQTWEAMQWEQRMQEIQFQEQQTQLAKEEQERAVSSKAKALEVQEEEEACIQAKVDCQLAESGHKWTCLDCGFDNPAGNEVCLFCDTPRGDGLASRT